MTRINYTQIRNAVPARDCPVGVPVKAAGRLQLHSEEKDVEVGEGKKYVLSGH